MAYGESTYGEVAYGLPADSGEADGVTVQTNPIALASASALLDAVIDASTDVIATASASASFDLSAVVEISTDVTAVPTTSASLNVPVLEFSTDVTATTSATASINTLPELLLSTNPAAIAKATIAGPLGARSLAGGEFVWARATASGSLTSVPALTTHPAAKASAHNEIATDDVLPPNTEYVRGEFTSIHADSETLIFAEASTYIMWSGDVRVTKVEYLAEQVGVTYELYVDHSIHDQNVDDSYLIGTAKVSTSTTEPLVWDDLDTVFFANVERRIRVRSIGAGTVIRPSVGAAQTSGSFPSMRTRRFDYGRQGEFSSDVRLDGDYYLALRLTAESVVVRGDVPFGEVILPGNVPTRSVIGTTVSWEKPVFVTEVLYEPHSNGLYDLLIDGKFVAQATTATYRSFLVFKTSVGFSTDVGRQVTMRKSAGGLVDPRYNEPYSMTFGDTPAVTLTGVEGDNFNQFHVPMAFVVEPDTISVESHASVTASASVEALVPVTVTTNPRALALASGDLDSLTATALFEGSGDFTAIIELPPELEALLEGSGEFSATVRFFSGPGDILSSGSTGTLSLDSEQLSFTPEFRFQILDTKISRAPTSLTLAVDGGQADTEISIYIDGTLVWVTTLDSEGGLRPTSVDVTVDVGGTKGAHTVRIDQVISSGVTISASADYEILRDPPAHPINAGVDAQAVQIPGTVQHDTRHWVFQDLLAEEFGGIGSYILPINPAAMTSPHYETLLESRHTTAITGQFHVTQAGNPPKEWEFSGYCPTQEMADMLLAYRGLNRRFYVIDHHNRAWKVVFNNVDLVPRLRHTFNGEVTDWGSDYKVSAYILDQDWTNPA